MHIKQFGRTGLKVSEICLGTMTFGNQADEPTACAIMDRAVAAGVSFFDTAAVYPLGGGLERVGRTAEIIGPWLRERGGRHSIRLATKCRGGMGPRPNDQGLSRKHIMAACEASLRRLGTDYLDLYQAHAPDPDTPLDETLRAFDDLVRSGKVRYIGCSNYRAFELATALRVSERGGLARYDCLQPRYNILYREPEHELLPLCAQEGIGVIAYNPLAGGFLSGKYRRPEETIEGTRFAVLPPGSVYHERYWQQAQFAAVQTLKATTDEAGLALPRVAVAWVLANPAITSAIVGATSPAQLDETLAAADTELPEAVRAACDEAWFALPRPRNPTVALR